MTLRASRQNRLVIPLLLCSVPLIVFAIYVRTAPGRAERALRAATYDDLVRTIKEDPANPRALYYFGIRNRELGRVGPARAALAHAARLDPESEDIALEWANVAGESGNDQEVFQILTDLLKRHPRSVDAHWALALFYAAHSDPGRAYAEAIAVTQLRPTEVRAWRLAGAQAMQMREQSLAEQALRRAVSLDPKDWRSQYGLGQSQANQGRDRDAIAAYTAAAALAPREPMVLASLGRAQLDAAANPAEISAARQSLSQAVLLDPENAMAQLSLGQAQLRLGDVAGAKEALTAAERHVISLGALRSNLHYALIGVFKRLQDADGVRRETALLQETRAYAQELDRLHARLSQGNLDAATCLRMAQSCAAHGDNGEAIALYRRLLTSPKYAERARLQLAKLTSSNPIFSPSSMPATTAHTDSNLSRLLAEADHLMLAGHTTQAADAYRSFLAQHADSALALQGLGAADRALGRNSEAFAALNRAIKLQPDLPRAQFLLAALYFDMGLQDESARRLQRLIQAQPPNAEYFNALGDCQRDDALTYLQAEANYRHATELDPQQSEYLINLADMETLNNKLQDAEGHYRKALQLKPDSAHAQLALGQYLLRQQETPERDAEAERLLRAALASIPGSARASLALGQLLTQRGDAKDAVPLLETAVLHAPDQKDGWYNLARAYTALHNRERAGYCYGAFKRLTILNDAVTRAVEETRTHPANAASHLKLARLYAQGGVNAQALNQYRVYLALRPHDTQVAGEFQRLMDTLRTKGTLPDMAFFNRMVAFAVKSH